MSYSWKEQRDELVRLIKKVSEVYGGDDPVWLKEYTKEVIKIYMADLSVPIKCFELLQHRNVVLRF